MAHSAKIKTESVAFRSTDDLHRAFETAHRAQVQAMIVLSSPLVVAHIRNVADLAFQLRLPVISTFPQFAEAGGLMGYGPNVVDLFRRAARYVDQILKGAKPSELPIQRPVVLDFALNLKTAKALGVTIPSVVVATGRSSHRVIGLHRRSRSGMVPEVGPTATAEPSETAGFRASRAAQTWHGSCNETRNAIQRRQAMRTAILCAALVTVVLAALPARAATDSIECNPAVCPSPVLGPGHHLDVETR